MAEVVTLNTAADRGKEFWLKRQAIQVVAQLPEDREAALAVLAYAESLVVDFLTKD